MSNCWRAEGTTSTALEFIGKAISVAIGPDSAPPDCTVLYVRNLTSAVGEKERTILGGVRWVVQKQIDHIEAMQAVSWTLVSKSVALHSQIVRKHFAEVPAILWEVLVPHQFLLPQVALNKQYVKFDSGHVDKLAGKKFDGDGPGIKIFVEIGPGPVVVVASQVAVSGHPLIEAMNYGLRIVEFGVRSWENHLIRGNLTNGIWLQS